MHRAPLFITCSFLAVLVAAVAVPRADDGADTRAADPAGDPASAGTSTAALNPAAPPPKMGEPRLDTALGRYVAPFGDGRAILTLVPGLQARLERSLETYRVPWGATVLLEPTTGRVLALAGYSRAEPGRKDLALRALAPAASIFKIVTAAALLEHGVESEDAVCYHGGKRRLDARLLRDDPRRDRRCASLFAAFGHSTNVVFAKLFDRVLAPEALRSMAERFMFNVPIAFPRPVEVSTLDVPADPFKAANTAAGFGSVRLTPLHGALLAAIVANGGVFVPPVLVEEAEGAASPSLAPPSRIVDQGIAAHLAAMMRETVEAGTARRAFARAASVLRGVHVAGKTGSLADANPFHDYSWFVGYAPAEKPEIAVATVVVNDRLWHARATTVAKEALEAYFASRAPIGGGVRTAAR